MTISNEQAEAELREKASTITDSDINKVFENKEAIEDKFKSAGPLERFIGDLKLLFSIVKDYISGEYREVPYFTIGAIVAALLYVLSPIDLIPDFIPVVGYLDDAAVVAVCLRMVEEDLRNYERWLHRKAIS